LGPSPICRSAYYVVRQAGTLSMKPQSPDNVCTEFADRARSLAIRLADPSTVLIEGDPESWRFLGELLVAQASYESDCGFEISPKGPGSAFFANRSGLGLY